MEDGTKGQPILYWYVVMPDECHMEYHIIYDGDHDTVPPFIAEMILDKAKSLLYPIICLN